MNRSNKSESYKNVDESHVVEGRSHLYFGISLGSPCNTVSQVLGSSKVKLITRNVGPKI